MRSQTCQRNQSRRHRYLIKSKHTPSPSNVRLVHIEIIAVLVLFKGAAAIGPWTISLFQSCLFVVAVVWHPCVVRFFLRVSNVICSLHYIQILVLNLTSLYIVCNACNMALRLCEWPVKVSERNNHSCGSRRCHDDAWFGMAASTTSHLLIVRSARNIAFLMW